MPLDVSIFRSRCLEEALKESASRLNQLGEEDRFVQMFGQQHPLTFLAMATFKGYWRGETSLQSLVIADTLKLTTREEIDRNVTEFLEPFDRDCKDFEACCMMSFLLPPTEWIPMVKVMTLEERERAIPDEAWEIELSDLLPHSEHSEWVLEALTRVESQWKIFLAAKPSLGGETANAHRANRTREACELLENRYRFVATLIVHQLIDRLKGETSLQAFERVFWDILQGHPV